MLIIPAESNLDWSRPPWITFALILVNILVFTLYQSDDQELISDAAERYQAAPLLELELPVYQSYLRRQANVHGDNDAGGRLEAVEEAIAEEQELALTYFMLLDRDFYDYAHDNGRRYWLADEQSRWQAVRGEIQTRYLDNISSLRFGLKPYDVQVSDLVVSQFLHGGWGHLIGNMVFLFLLGFAIEQALGARAMCWPTCCAAFSRA